MIGATTTAELSPTGIDGDGFDVFSSLRDGADGEKFASGIGEVVADGAGQLDLVAVASCEAELDVAMSNKDDSREKPTPTNPEQCQKFGTAACIGCIFAQNCQDRQAAMMEKNNNLQPEEQLSTLEQLLREDEAPGEIVWAQAVPETDEAGDLGQIEEVLEAVSPNVMEAAPDGENVTEEDDSPKEQTSNVHNEEDCKAEETTIEVVKNAGVDDHAAKPQATNPILDKPAEMSEQLTPEDKVILPTPMPVEAEPVVPIVEDTKKVKDDFTDTVASDVQASPQIEIKEPKLVEVVDTADSLSPVSPVEVPSRETPSHTAIADDTGDGDNSYRIVSEPEEKSAPPATEQGPSVQMSDAPVNVLTEDVKHEIPTKELVAIEAPMPVDVPVVHEVVEVVPTENAAIELEAPTPIIPVETVVDEDELWTNPPQDGNQEVAVDQTVYEAQTSPVEQRDDAAIEKRSCDEDEVWAEEDVVFFVEQSSVAEPEAPLAEVVTTGPLTEAMIVTSEEVDELEVFVADEIEIEPVEPLDNLQLASVPEITKDNHELMEQSVISISSAIEPVSDVTLDEVPVQRSEEYGLPCEKPADVITTTLEGNDLWLGGDELEAMAMDGSDAEQNGDLFEEQEDPIVINGMAEMAETELSEQNDLAVAGAVDNYGYNSEMSTVSDNILVVKNHPSLGLWSDDSRLNPEEEATATVQPGADDASLVSRLVGVLVVAMCVARGRRARAIVSSR